jgi:ABC-2 type transport system ATP-binding protein
VNDVVLRTDKLKKSFAGHAVIRELSFEVPKGSIYGFLGRNGAGKTTAIRMLLGILRPDSGTIELEGVSVRHTPPSLRARIGYVSQEPKFYDWMTGDQLGRFVGGFFRDWDHARFGELLDRLKVPKWQRAGAMSGGTRMKLAVALSLAHDPALLVLDEPTAGVDPVTRREILDLLRSVAKQGRGTVLFSTHYVSEVEDAGDLVGILHEGRLFWQGTVSGYLDRVRRASVIPEGGRALFTEEGGVIAWGEPEAWASMPSERLSLEDAFIALVRDA